MRTGALLLLHLERRQDRPGGRCGCGVSQACEEALADGACLDLRWIEAAAAGMGVHFPYQCFPGVPGPGHARPTGRGCGPDTGRHLSAGTGPSAREGEVGRAALRHLTSKCGFATLLDPHGGRTASAGLGALMRQWKWGGMG